MSLTPEKVIMYSPDGKQPQAVLEISGVEDYYASFTLYGVTAWNMDNTIYDGPEGLEQICAGSIKWDGCCNWYFGDEGDMHICGRNDLEQFVKKLTWAFDEVTKRIEKYDARV